MLKYEGNMEYGDVNSECMYWTKAKITGFKGTTYSIVLNLTNLSRHDDNQISRLSHLDFAAPNSLFINETSDSTLDSSPATFASSTATLITVITINSAV